MCSCIPILRYTSSALRKALRASRSAPLRPALCACRAARHRRNPPETEGTIRGHAIPQQGPVSYHTPQKSPPSRLGHSYRTQPRPPRSSKTVARPLGNLSDEERVHTGNVFDDLSVFDRATTVCVARHPIVHAVVSPCQRAQTFCKLWCGLPVNPVSFRLLGTHASHGTDVFRLQGLVGARRLLQTLERSLREPRELPDSGAVSPETP